MKKIKDLWFDFKGKNQWITFSQNCSTTIAQALANGDGLSHLSNGDAYYYYVKVTVWTPNDVQALATKIAEAAEAAETEIAEAVEAATSISDKKIDRDEL
jgi:hypothetical protein